jgi:HK97 family phage major capsid protein
MEVKEQIEEMGKSITEAILGAIPEMIAKEVDAKVEAKGIARLEKKIFGGAEEASKLEGGEKIAKFFQAVRQNDSETVNALTAKEKAMSGGTDANGGFLVPDEFRSEVVRLAEAYGIIRKLARTIPMQRDTLKLPKITASVAVYWPGEGVAGTVAQPTLGQVTLLAKTLVGLTPVTNELLEDADADTISLLVELFSEAIAGEEDNQGLAGTGSPFTGVLADAGVTVVTQATGDTTFAKVTADYLRDMISSVKPLVLQGAVFVMHRSVWATVQKLKGSDGQYIATTANPITTKDATQGVGIVGYAWGYPVYLSEKMPFSTAISTKYVIFGNFNYLYLGDRRQMTVAVSDQATIGSTNLFESNMSALRITERIGMTIAIPTAFVCLKTSAS